MINQHEGLNICDIEARARKRERERETNLIKNEKSAGMEIKVYVTLWTSESTRPWNDKNTSTL